MDNPFNLTDVMPTFNCILPMQGSEGSSSGSTASIIPRRLMFTPSANTRPFKFSKTEPGTKLTPRKSTSFRFNTADHRKDNVQIGSMQSEKDNTHCTGFQKDKGKNEVSIQRGDQGKCVGYTLPAVRFKQFNELLSLYLTL